MNSCLLRVAWDNWIFHLDGDIPIFYMCRHWTILVGITQSCNTTWGLEFLWALRSRNARLTDFSLIQWLLYTIIVQRNEFQVVHDLQHKKAIWMVYHLVSLFFFLSFPRPSEERRVPAESLEWLADEVSLAWSEVWGRKKTDFSELRVISCFSFPIIASEVNIFHERLHWVVWRSCVWIRPSFSCFSLLFKGETGSLRLHSGASVAGCDSVQLRRTVFQQDGRKLRMRIKMKMMSRTLDTQSRLFQPFAVIDGSKSFCPRNFFPSASHPILFSMDLPASPPRGKWRHDLSSRDLLAGLDIETAKTWLFVDADVIWLMKAASHLISYWKLHYFACSLVD